MPRNIISKLLFGGSILVNLCLILFIFLRSPHQESSTDISNTLNTYTPGLGGSSLLEIPNPVFNKRGYNSDYLFPLNPGNFKEFSSLYGPRLDVFGKGIWRNHEGIDLTSYTPQANVYAIADGVVIESYWDFVYGVMVKLRHSDGSTSLYAHLFYETKKKYQLRQVFKGYIVQRGQILGRIGNTGLSTAPHLHFEFNPSKKTANNPLNWIPYPET